LIYTIISQLLHWNFFSTQFSARYEVRFQEKIISATKLKIEISKTSTQTTQERQSLFRFFLREKKRQGIETKKTTTAKSFTVILDSILNFPNNYLYENESISNYFEYKRDSPTNGSCQCYFDSRQNREYDEITYAF